MDYFKSEAIKEFKTRVMYIGAFVEGELPKNRKVVSEELPNKNPEGENHVTLFYLGDFYDVGEELFDDILSLPERTSVYVKGYGFNHLNQGISVLSNEFDFQDSHLYSNIKAIPHITYSWDEKNGGEPVKTGELNFVDIPELYGIKINLIIKAYLHTGEMIPLQYFRDRAAGTIPSIPANYYHEFANHNQNTPYHCFDLRDHTIHVVNYVINHFESANIALNIKLPLIIAAQWHDIGKLFTKSINEDGFNIYPGHPKSSSDEFEKYYNGDNKELISFFIANHDYFLFYSKSELTDELVDSLKKKIQADTSFEIIPDYWRALTLLMEADESAKNPTVIINGTIARTMDDDFEKIHYLRSKLLR